MAVDKNTKKNTYSPHKGIPSNDGKPKAETKETGEERIDPERKEKLRDRYTQEIDEPADDVKANPNRNRDKVDINKPRYS